MNKYELLKDVTMPYHGRTLYRIRALKDFADVKKGDLGGWVESEDNLSQEGACWVYDEAKAYGHARIYENAQIRDYAEAYGHAPIGGFVIVRGSARVRGYPKVCGLIELDKYAILSTKNEHSYSDRSSLPWVASLVNGHYNVYGYTKVGGAAPLRWDGVGKKDDSIHEISIQYPECLEDFKKVIEFEAKKYAPNDWLTPNGKGTSHTEMCNSMFHYLSDVYNKKSTDNDSGLDPLLHLATRALMYYARKQLNITNDVD